MTPPSLTFDAHLPRPAFALKERITLSIVARNAGAAAAVIPDPFAGSGAALTLVLRPSGGAADRLGSASAGVERRRSPADEPPLPGVPPEVANALVLPGGEHTFTLDVAAFFALARPGAFGLVVEYTWAPGQTWRSGELRFSITPAAARFLDAVPTEAAALGYHAILWVEPEGAGARAILFDDGPFGPALFGAREVLAGLGADAEPALSTAPAGLPQMDRWIAFVGGGALHVGFLSEADGLSLPPHPTPLPAGHGAPRIIRPPLAEDAPDEPRPLGAIGLVAPRAGGGSDFLLAMVDRAGAASFAPAIALPGPVLGAWATAPSAWGGVFVLAIAAPGAIRLLGIAAPWGGMPGAPTDLLTLPADALLLGDVRSDLDSHVHVGLLVQRGARWARVTFSPPVADPGKDVITEDWSPGQGATAARVRLDDAGKLHVLYRQGGQLCYLPPGAIYPTWSSARLDAKTSFEQLLLRPKHPRLLVHYDADEGASIEPI